MHFGQDTVRIEYSVLCYDSNFSHYLGCSDVWLTLWLFAYSTRSPLIQGLSSLTSNLCSIAWISWPNLKAQTCRYSSTAKKPLNYIHELMSKFLAVPFSIISNVILIRVSFLQMRASIRRGNTFDKFSNGHASGLTNLLFFAYDRKGTCILHTQVKCHNTIRAYCFELMCTEQTFSFVHYHYWIPKISARERFFSSGLTTTYYHDILCPSNNIRIFLHWSEGALRCTGLDWHAISVGMVSLSTYRPTVCTPYDYEGTTTILSECIRYYAMHARKFRSCE